MDAPTRSSTGIPASPRTARLFGAYHESWSELAVGDAQGTRLARLPSYLDFVFLAFARPDSVYDDTFDLTRTGLGFPFDGRTARSAVLTLRRRNPAIRILLSIGGSTYKNWNRLNAAAIGRVVVDLGLDGIDVDYEPANAGCGHDDAGAVHCEFDEEFIAIVTELRNAIPRPAILSVAGWSVGAFGEGAWRDMVPRSRYTGMAIKLLHSPAAGAIDFMSIMAYDAGPAYDPKVAEDAYRALYDGPLLLGLSVYDETRGRTGATMNPETLTRYGDVGRSGFMLYSLEMTSPVDRPGHRRAAEFVKQICFHLGRGNCDEEVP